ncbi:F0F1 ATP synthase subunit epsilon [Flagellatimonas centrodinii]|uniref:F0F1 ATP synthase subunit epsilon n=1 Tax=Flagellatimonas centrodinii TaxID=2806210 RepID=UPI00344E8272
MMSELQIEIVSAEGHIHAGSATMVFAPAEMGEVGITPGHAPLLTRLKPGAVRVKTTSGEELPFFVGGGLLEVQPKRVTVMADTALRAKDADEAAAAAAKQAAEDALSNAASDIDVARAQAELVEAAARLHFVQNLKKTR